MMTKNKLFFIILIVLSLLSAFAILISTNGYYSISNNNYNNKNETIVIGENNTEKIPTFVSNQVNSTSTLEDLKSKPLLIFFVEIQSTNSIALMPEVEKEIWEKYKLETNIWINILDGKDGSKFNLKNIKQGYNENFDLQEMITGCYKVPSFILFDKDGNKLLDACGATKESILKINEILNKEIYN